MNVLVKKLNERTYFESKRTVAQGSCASGFGVCCGFSGGCGGSTSANNTYFTSDSSSDTSPCTFSVCRTNDNICQLVLVFASFVLPAPDTAVVTDVKSLSYGNCYDARFEAESYGSSALHPVCGTNTGYHMILEADPACNSLQFTWNSGSPSWNILVYQVCSNVFTLM